MKEISRDEGRRAFGTDPASYNQGRPEYPGKVYEILQVQCGLRQGSKLFEIGPGTGLATKRLLELGADPIVAIEPDERLAAFLADSLKKYSDRIQIKIATFEDVDLPLAWFDIGVAATAMHWLDEETALRKVARTLQPGGWWAMWWNVFRDPEQPDELTEAAPNLLSGLDRSPSAANAGRPTFALDTEMRVSILSSINEFEKISAELLRWDLSLDAAGVKRLFATFSEINRLPNPEAKRLLEKLGQTVDDLGGRVQKHIVTPIYLAQRKR